MLFGCDWNGARVNKDRVTCVTDPSDICVLTTREGYGTSLDLVLWEVLINESLVGKTVFIRGRAPAVASAGPVSPTLRVVRLLTSIVRWKASG